MCSQISVCHLKVLFIGDGVGTDDLEGEPESVDMSLLDSVCPHEKNKNRQSKYAMRGFIFTGLGLKLLLKWRKLENGLAIC